MSGPRRAGRLDRADDRLAQSVVKRVVPSGRVYKCSTCGVGYPAEDLNPEMDQDGRRVGWACDSCY